MDRPRPADDYHLANQRYIRDLCRALSLAGFFGIFWNRAAWARFMLFLLAFAVFVYIFVITVAFAMRLAPIEITTIG